MAGGDGEVKARGILPILGTMTFGADGQVKPFEAGTILRSFCGSSCAKTPAGVLVDTARIYQSENPDGDTEATIGALFSSFPSLVKRCSIATKANPGMAPHHSLSRQSVTEQLNTSLEKMGVASVDIFYLHYPDIKTDLEDTLSGVEALHKLGNFKEFGLSNYPAWAVADIWHRCKRRGMITPTVYQGMYNMITRDVERELIPVLREFGMKFYVYNPLAGGLLSGRYSTLADMEKATAGRFSSEELRKTAALYRARYAKEQLLQAVNIMRSACEPAKSSTDSASGNVEETVTEVDGIKVRVIVEEKGPQAKGLDLPNVALRWLLHHSLLEKGDGIILGISKNEHLAANLGAWHCEALPAAVVEAAESAWEAAKPACEPYFRGFGKEPGGVEQFLKLKAEMPPSKRARV
eukprot:TRINITY_DN34154_c0_g1_i1.p1 TRINITY_DN34154_c0_g1~~TRINITY_DN34154_c0_g1_i1.p1  ORF type:complete len:408 (-),score=83.50 TRINITY_DN34154_c0_g1_i1:20-1243(-)